MPERATHLIDGQRDAARVLFEGLWWYDQIEFDTSRLPGCGPNGETRS